MSEKGAPNGKYRPDVLNDAHPHAMRNSATGRLSVGRFV